MPTAAVHPLIYKCFVTKEGNVVDCKHVAGLDVSCRTVEYNVADLESYGRYAVGLFAGLVLHECDVSGSVGVVLQSVRSETSSMRTSRSVKQVRSVTWVSVLPFAVPL